MTRTGTALLQGVSAQAPRSGECARWPARVQGWGGHTVQWVGHLIPSIPRGPQKHCQE